MELRRNSMVLLSLMLSGFISHVSFASDGSKWGYDEHDGPNEWPGVCQTGERQSPINFQAANIEYKHFSPLHFRNYDHEGSVNVTNNGHSLVVSGFDTWKQKPFIHGGGLRHRYNLVQFHLHWAQNNYRGSEHTLASLHYPAELHFVHLKEKTTLAEAMDEDDGLAVIGVFLTLGNNGHAMHGVDRAVAHVQHETNFTQLDELNLQHLLPYNTDAYYRYDGSLTTPGCQETVIWTVLSEPITITEKQLNHLRRLKDTHDRVLNLNYRPVQKLNGRKVFFKSSLLPMPGGGDSPGKWSMAWVMVIGLLCSTFYL